MKFELFTFGVFVLTHVSYNVMENVIPSFLGRKIRCFFLEAFLLAVGYKVKMLSGLLVGLVIVM